MSIRLSTDESSTHVVTADRHLQTSRQGRNTRRNGSGRDAGCKNNRRCGRTSSGRREVLNLILKCATTFGIFFNNNLNSCSSTNKRLTNLGTNIVNLLSIERLPEIVTKSEHPSLAKKVPNRPIRLTKHEIGPLLALCICAL